jgi:hypothetical protein
MTAQRLAIAGSVAMLVLGAAVNAGADTGRQGSAGGVATLGRAAGAAEVAAPAGLAINLSRPGDVGAALAEIVPSWQRAQRAAEAYEIDVESIHLGRRGRPRRGATDTASTLVAAYAGLDRRLLQLSLDLGNGGLRFRKEKGERRDRLFLGMLYSPAPRTHLAVEYRAFPSDILVKVRHRF